MKSRSISRKRRLLIVLTLGVCILLLPPIAAVLTNMVSWQDTSISAAHIDMNVTADNLKPSDCDGISLTVLLTGSGTFSGTNANSLLIGSSGVDTVSGGTGDDCILGGAGNDTLIGGGGTDVCVGHAGTTFDATCETHVP